MATIVGSIMSGGKSSTIYRCSVKELAEQVQTHIGAAPLPDLNLDRLKDALMRGWKLKEIQLEPHGGPVVGFVGVRFKMERNGLKVIVPVSPGEGLVQLLLEKADEWEKEGVIAHYIVPD